MRVLSCNRTLICEYKDRSNEGISKADTNLWSRYGWRGVWNSNLWFLGSSQKVTFASAILERVSNFGHALDLLARNEK